MLDLLLFRTNPELIRESQRRRFDPVEWVDEVIALDSEHGKTLYELSQINAKFNKMKASMGKMYGKMKMLQKKGDAATDEEKKELEAVQKEIEDAKKEQAECKAQKPKLEELVKELAVKVHKARKRIGNLVHDSVPVSENEDEHNRVERTFGKQVKPDEAPDNEDKRFYRHDELLSMVDAFDTTRGSGIAGHRAYFLRGIGVQLNLALIQYGLDFLSQQEYEPLQTPFFMRREIMAETCQLADNDDRNFDDDMYKIPMGGEPKDDLVLIATSEQPISAFHRGEWMDPKQFPVRYAGYSSCFRKEAGKAGKDVRGIFRVHQFEKVEQFILTSPDEDASWKELERMLATSEKFYQSLEIPYRVVTIVSGELNNAAAKKYDLEAWFPGEQTWRELVSCSNCTDYQSRGLGVRYGSKADSTEKKFVHMLNGTLTATERTLCCIAENFQEKDGIRVPKVLQNYLGGKEFIPFVKPVPTEKTKEEKRRENPNASKNGGGKAKAKK